MRLAIKVGEEFVDLLPDTALQLDMNSPLYFGDRDPDILPGTKAYSVNIPLTSGNRRRLKRPDLLDNYDDFVKNETCIIFYDNEQILEGIANIVESHSADYCELQFIGGLSGNLANLKTKKLNELTMGGDRDIGPNQADVITHANDVVANPDNYDYVFPTVYIDDIANSYDYINHYDDNTFFKYKSISSVDTYSTLVPFPKVKYVLEQIFLEEGYRLKGIFDYHEHSIELGNIILYNNYTLDDQTVFTDPVIPSDTEFVTFINLQNHVPETNINTFLKQVANTFGWAIIIKTKTKDVFIVPYNDILSASTVINWTNKVENTFLKKAKLDSPPTKFGYAHTEEYFLPTVDNYPRDLDYWRYNYQGEVERVPDLIFSLIGPVDVYYVQAINTYFRFEAFSPPEWYYCFKEIASYGEGINAFLADSKTLFMRSNPTVDLSLDPYKKLVPFTFDEIISPLITESDKIKETTFLFWRGLQFAATTSDYYPFASNHVYRAGQFKISDANVSLLWIGEYGLYNVWWKNWHTFLQNTRTVIYNTRLTPGDLTNLDWSKKVRIEKHDYFVKRIQITLTTTDIKPAIVEYAKIN